ncbi:MAG: hypothetical protein Q8L45_07665 [Xanthomonadaceae bacterium]|nr:hypothetical protein [Xanthomonadaceae bacterium]MDP2183953.1 hypothetical protein [Xanthomonadales bacterium]MDZ4116520.1 hypothetical protein [Xanthomonadaceae bacterium]MDZ4378740.1 hypothetical protein [Xanthomonadaceae bacterium]
MSSQGDGSALKTTMMPQREVVSGFGHTAQAGFRVAGQPKGPVDFRFRGNDGAARLVLHGSLWLFLLL